MWVITAWLTTEAMWSYALTNRLQESGTSLLITPTKQDKAEVDQVRPAE